MSCSLKRILGKGFSLHQLNLCYNTRVPNLGLIMVTKAVRTLVNFAGHEIEIVMDDEKNLYVTTQQFNALTAFSSLPQNTSRDLKRLMGEGFRPFQLKIEGQNANSSAMTIVEFEKALVELAFKGNQITQDLVRDLTGLAIVQLSYDAFGIKHEADERNAWLDTRFKSKKVRRHLTDILKEWGDTNQTSVNYGKLTAIFYTITGLRNGRDTYSEDELDHCLFCEKYMDKKISQGFSPEQALKHLKTVA